MSHCEHCKCETKTGVMDIDKDQCIFVLCYPCYYWDRLLKFLRLRKK